MVGSGQHAPLLALSKLDVIHQRFQARMHLTLEPETWGLIQPMKQKRGYAILALTKKKKSVLAWGTVWEMCMDESGVNERIIK